MTTSFLAEYAPVKAITRHVRTSVICRRHLRQIPAILSVEGTLVNQIPVLLRRPLMCQMRLRHMTASFFGRQAWIQGEALLRAPTTGTEGTIQDTPFNGIQAPVTQGLATLCVQSAQSRTRSSEIAFLRNLKNVQLIGNTRTEPH